MCEIPEIVLKTVRKAAEDDRLTCTRAHELAKELGVNLLIVGQACDELKIKIKACQLGCF